MSKITYIVTALKGSALRWVHDYLAANPVDSLSYATFFSDFKRVFELPFQQEVLARKHLSLKQGKRSVTTFAIDFWVATQEADWDEAPLKGIFVNSITEKIKAQLALRAEPERLDEVINLVIRIDNHLRERRMEKNYNSQWQPTSTSKTRPCLHYRSSSTNGGLFRTGTYANRPRSALT